MKPVSLTPMEELSLDSQGSLKSVSKLTRLIPALAFIVVGVLIGYLTAYLQGRSTTQEYRRQVAELTTQVAELRSDLATTEKHEELLRQAVNALKENSIARSRPAKRAEPANPDQAVPSEKRESPRPVGDAVPQGRGGEAIPPEKKAEPENLAPPFVLQNGECHPVGKTPAEQAAGFMACINLLNESDPARKSTKHKQVP